MWERIREIIRKELRQTLRNPRTRGMLFLPPLIQLLIFGYAVNLDVDNARIAWVDMDRTPESRELRAAFEGSRRFQVLFNPASEAEAQRLLDASKIQAAAIVFPRFAQKVNRGDPTSVQILVDGTNSNTASLISSYANEIVGDFANRTMAAQQTRKLVARTMATGAPVNTGVPSIDVRSRVWFNPDLLSRNYFVPGVVVNIIMVVTVMLTAMAIVREKEIGTMEQLMVTPIRPVELILGKTLPFAAVGLFDVILVTGAALLVFHIPFQGNILFLLACSMLFLLTTVGLGVFMSTVSQTQQQAVMGSFFFNTPAFMLSGFAFPIRNMPAVVQYISYLNPLRYFMQIVRGIFLKGTGISILWPQMLALLVYGVLILGISALRFHKRLD
ncbi:MAG: ABC transporter permease [Bryobacteraceae bacterium]